MLHWISHFLNKNSSIFCAEMCSDKCHLAGISIDLSVFSFKFWVEQGVYSFLVRRTIRILKIKDGFW